MPYLNNAIVYLLSVFVKPLFPHFNPLPGLGFAVCLSLIQQAVAVIIAFQVPAINRYIVFHHVQCRMPEDFLEPENIPAVHNPVFCEGVPEQVDTCLLNAPAVVVVVNGVV